MDLQIHDLIILQQMDTDIRRERDIIASIPAAIAAVEERARAMESALAKRREGLDEAQKEGRKLEGELDQARGKLSKYETQLMQVKTNEAYRAMLKELDTVKQDIVAHEERILERMLQADELETEIKGGEVELQKANADLEEEKIDLEGRKKVAQEQQGDLERQRDEVAARLSSDTLSTYERIATMRGGRAVAPAVDEICLGCRVKQRPQVFEEIRQGCLRQCDSCGRFLFFAPGEGEPSGAAAAPPPAADPPDKPPA